MLHLLFAGLLLTAPQSPQTATVQDAKVAPQLDFQDLFNGKDLEGWTRVNTAPSTWVVRDGLLHCTGKPTGELRTTRMYQNFVLEVEWRHLVPAGNAGIFVWADDITAKGVPFHRSVEVQVLDHAYGNTASHTTHGDIFPIHGATMTPVNGRGGSRAFPTELRSKPSPEWNHYRITCRDGAIALEVNGKLVTQGKDSSLRKGYICLESEGGQVDYRNIRIAELPETPLEPGQIAQADRGFQTLYNGVDLDGLRGGDTWQPRDWLLSWAGKEQGSLTTERSFDQVGFVLDVRRKPGNESLSFLPRGVSPGAVDLGSLSEGWHRLEGQLRGKRMSLSIDGKALLSDQLLPMLPEQGVFTIRAEGPVDLANWFVRPLEPKDAATRKR